MSGDLDHSVEEIVANLLVDAGLATLVESSGSWPIFISFERDDPDNALTCYKTADVTHGRHMVGGDTQLHYGIQIRVRSQDHNTGRNKAQDVYNEFDDVQRRVVTISSSDYLVQAIHNQSGPLSLGTESANSRRRLFTLNALVALRMTS